MSFDLPDIVPKPMNSMFIIHPDVRTGKQRLMHAVPTES
jgi:hypothetical protein